MVQFMKNLTVSKLNSLHRFFFFYLVRGQPMSAQFLIEIREIPYKFTIETVNTPYHERR